MERSIPPYPGFGPEETAYLKKVQELMSDISGIDWTRQITSQVLWAGGPAPSLLKSPSEVIRRAAIERERETTSVCIIENISQEYIGMLGAAWDINPAFFVIHGKNPAAENLWHIHRRYIDEPTKDWYDSWCCLDGIFEYHGVYEPRIETINSLPNLFPRRCFKDGSWPIQSNTRISYYRVHPMLYLFLVDAPISITNNSFFVPSLRCLYATNRGGVLLPRLNSQLNYHEYRLFDSLQAFFKHGWHFSVLFGEGDGDRSSVVIPPHPLLYLISSSLWETNLGELERLIRHASFHDIKRPTVDTNNTLHDYRQSLFDLKTGVTETISWADRNITGWFARHSVYKQARYAGRKNPILDLERILNDAKQLEAFLMETFQLCMSSISIQDSQASIQQTKRATMLTQLAFIYIPLSFITGVFGMNIQEMNGSGLHIWVFFVTLIIAIILTVVLFFGLDLFQKKKERRRDERMRLNTSLEK